ILSLRFGGGIRAVVIDLVSLPSAHIKISYQGGRRRSHRNFQRLESRQVVSRSDNTETRAGYHYFRQLKGGVVGGGKTPVGGHRLHGGILQVTLDDVA